MLDKARYEKRILNEVRAMPEESLPTVVRLLALIREEFTVRHTAPELSEDDGVSHEKTRKLLATSKSNWAWDIAEEREDRI